MTANTGVMRHWSLPDGETKRLVEPGHRHDSERCGFWISQAKVHEDLHAFTGKPVRLRFTLTHGSLYSFWITSDPHGSSGGYLAAGGPDYPGIKDSAHNP